MTRGVKVGREEIDTRYGVMLMIHWCNDSVISTYSIRPQTYLN